MFSLLNKYYKAVSVQFQKDDPEHETAPSSFYKNLHVRLDLKKLVFSHPTII